MENKIKNLNRITTNIDMDKIDYDSFGEGLLACVANIKQNCKLINRQVKHMASIAFVPWVNTTEQYDAIVDQMLLKSELIDLYKMFTQWANTLDEKKKKLFVAYFIRKDGKLCAQVVNNTAYYKRHILPMARSFMKYVDKVSDVRIKDLIRNPFVYGYYKDTLMRKEGISTKSIHRFV